jgi:hypothetical protein
MGVAATRSRGPIFGAALALAGALGAIAAGAAPAQVAGTPAQPIVSGATTAPSFVGHAAKPDPKRRGWKVPRHPHMAPNGRSNLHNDAYQTDAYDRRGPLGRRIGIRSTLFERNCASLTFDARGRIVTICIGFDGPVLVMLQPKTLATLAVYTLPPRPPSGGDPFTNISGGGYFYLDNRNRVVVPTTTRHLFIIKETGGPGFRKVADYDLSGVVPADAGILSALPDWRGRIWFAATDGVVGWVAPGNGSIHKRALGEEIANSFAVDATGGVFVVTNRALYRFDARSGKVHTSWRRRYPNSGVQKPGQLAAGSGTTPTLIGRNGIAITDNARRMHVIVYRRGRNSRGRQVCRRGVFKAGASATENSLVAYGRSLIVENNYGYTFAGVSAGGRTTPGISRIDVRRGHCRTVWTSRQRGASVVPKVSLPNGLLYTYTLPVSADGSQAWYFTALDLDSGRRVFSKRTGAGIGFNNHYAPISLGRGGVAYVGVLGGLLRLADSR